MTAKCGSCYWNVTLPSCAYSYMALHGEDCDEWRPAKEYERGRPKGGRGGISMTGTTPNVDTIICGDCLEEMRRFPDNHFDAIVTDPPKEGKECIGFSPAKEHRRPKGGRGGA